MKKLNQTSTDMWVNTLFNYSAFTLGYMAFLCLMTKNKRLHIYIIYIVPQSVLVLLFWLLVCLCACVPVFYFSGWLLIGNRGHKKQLSKTSEVSIFTHQLGVFTRLHLSHTFLFPVFSVWGIRFQLQKHISFVSCVSLLCGGLAAHIQPTYPTRATANPCYTIMCCAVL